MKCLDFEFLWSLFFLHWSAFCHLFCMPNKRVIFTLSCLVSAFGSKITQTVTTAALKRNDEDEEDNDELVQETMAGWVKSTRWYFLSQFSL